MYCNCPKCGKLFKVELYLLNDIENEYRVTCPKCKRIFEYADRIIDVTDYMDIKNSLTSKCVHLDNNYNPIVRDTVSGKRCLYCGKFISSEEYQEVLSRSKSLLRNLSNKDLKEMDFN